MEKHQLSEGGMMQGNVKPLALHQQVLLMVIEITMATEFLPESIEAVARDGENERRGRGVS